MQAELEALAADDPPLAVRLERRPGQKDARWTHLLGGTHGRADPHRRRAPTTTQPRPTAAPAACAVAGAPAPDGLAEEVRALRAEVDELRAVVDQLREALGD